MSAPRIFGAEMTKLDHTVDVTYGLEVNLAECFVARLGHQRWSGSCGCKFIGYHKTEHEAALAIERELRSRDSTKSEAAK